MKEQYMIQNISRTAAGVTVTLAPTDSSEDCSSFFMSEELWKKVKRKTGDILYEEDFNGLKNKEILSRCISRALKILASSDQSINQLKKKLSTYEFKEDAIEETLSYVLEHGYVDENRQALRLSEYFVLHKFWGKKRIAAELIMRGYKKEAILYALNSTSEKTYMRALHALLDRKYGLVESEDDKNKLFASLFRMGYSLSEIRRAIEELESGLVED